MIGACTRAPVQLSVDPTSAPYNSVMGSTGCWSWVDLSFESSLFGLACLGGAQNLAVRKPGSVRQAVSAFSSFSEGQSPYSRKVEGRFSTNGVLF